MKLKTKIALLFSTLIIVYIIFISVVVVGVSNYYIVNKVDDLETYISKTSNYEDVNNYAITSGFVPVVVLPDGETMGYTSQNEGEIAVTYSSDNYLTDLIISSSSNVEYEYVDNMGVTVNVIYQLNPVIVNEFCMFIIIIAFISFILFMLTLIVIMYFISKNVTKPAKQIIKYINDEEEVLINKNPEFNGIYLALKADKAQVIKEKENNNNLIKALTHEFKTPYNQILSLIYLHKKQMDGYTNIEVIEEKILEIVNENESLINKFLQTYDSNNNSEIIDVNYLISSILKNFTTKEISLDINKINIKTNATIFEFIVSNIITNAIKYHNNYIKIYLKDNILIFENDYIKEINGERRLKIVSNLANIIDIKCNINSNEIFIVELELSSVITNDK